MADDLVLNNKKSPFQKQAFVIMNITKLELCNRVAKRMGLQDKNLSANTLETVFETFMDEILTVMAEGRNLELRGFGSFKTKVRKERLGRNPRSGDTVEIPAYKAPTFKFSKDGQKNFTKKLEGELPNKLVKKMVYTAKNETQEPPPARNKTVSALKTAENFGR